MGIECLYTNTDVVNKLEELMAFIEKRDIHIAITEICPKTGFMMMIMSRIL